MLNLLLSGQNWVKIKISTSAHTYNIRDNHMRRNEMYSVWNKELFVFQFWRLSEDMVSKREKTGQFFQVSIHFYPLHPWPQTTKNSFSALQWLLATKPQHYFLVFIDAKMSFMFSEV